MKLNGTHLKALEESLSIIYLLEDMAKKSEGAPKKQPWIPSNEVKHISSWYAITYQI